MTVKISVITISFNSGKEIARTIESVLKQEYLPMEYWIIDGASRDDTVAIAQSYEEAFREKGVSYKIISEPDEGIYDAMNKGIQMAGGEVVGLINSGDEYVPQTLEIVRRTFRETDCELMFGDIQICTEKGKVFIKVARQRKLYQTSRDWNHPTMFVKSGLCKQYPYQNKGIHDDYTFYLKMRKQKRRIVVVDQVLARFRLGGASNQKSWKAVKKRIHDRYNYCYRENGYSRWYLLECFMIEAAKWMLG